MLSFKKHGSTVPLRQQYKICYSWVRELRSFEQVLECLSEGTNEHRIISGRIWAINEHLEEQFNPRLVRLCKDEYADFRNNFDSYTRYAWLIGQSARKGWEFSRAWRAIRRLTEIAAPQGIPF